MKYSMQYEFEYPDVAQFPCPVLEFDFDMNCSQITHILGCVGLVTVLLRCFAEAARKLRGSTAEGTHAQTTVLPADALTKSKPKTNRRSK